MIFLEFLYIILNDGYIEELRSEHVGRLVRVSVKIQELNVTLSTGYSNTDSHCKLSSFTKYKNAINWGNILGGIFVISSHKTVQFCI